MKKKKRVREDKQKKGKKGKRKSGPEWISSKRKKRRKKERARKEKIRTIGSEEVFSFSERKKKQPHAILAVKVEEKNRF